MTCVLRHVQPEAYHHDALALVRHLIEIFRVIDVNGDRALEWSEFTSFCIESGNAAVQRVPKPAFSYLWDGKFSDEYSRASAFAAVSFLPDLNVLLVIEAGSKVVRLYSPRMAPLCSLDCGLALERGPRGVDASGAKGFAYAARDRLLAVLLSNHAVVLWGLTDKDVWALEGVLPPPPPACLCISIAYDPYSGTLLLGCSSGAILCYSASERRLLRILEGHSDVVLSIVAVPAQQGLVTSALDGRVLLWDMNRGKVRRALRGHVSHMLRMLAVEALNLVVGVNGKGVLVVVDLSVGEVCARVVFHGLATLVDFAVLPSSPPRVVTLDSEVGGG